MFYVYNNNMKKLLIFVFSLLFSVTLVFGGTYIIVDRVAPDAVPEESVDMPIEGNANWLDVATNSRPGGSGTSSDPYRIDSAQTFAN